jgi:acyl carrier protein
MSHEQVLRRVTTILREVFDDEDLVPTSTMSAKDVAEWDSLSHIRLMVAIEKAFRIHFTTSEVSGIPDVGHLVDVIVAKLAADGRQFEG